VTDQQASVPAPKALTSEPSVTPIRRRPVLLIVLVVLTVVVVSGYFLWKHFFALPEIPRSIVALSGRIEGDDSAVAAKAAGRITEIRVREGDQVKGGDVIAILDDEQIRAREQQAQSAVDQAEAQLRSARQQIAILNEQLNESQLQIGQARQESQGQVRQAEAELQAAEAALAQQEAAYKMALFDRDAYTKLAKSGAVSERQGKQAETNADTQAALVRTARRRVESAQAAVAQSKAALVNPEIRTSQASMVRQQMAQQQTQIASAEAQAGQARARLREAQANRNDLQVRAPFDGTVATRTAEPGEVVNAGSPLITLLDLSKVYLRGFVPEGQIGRVRVGQAARVYLDSAPTRPVEAYLSRIDPQASFTPENTYFRNDRVKQVVGVKLQLKGAIGYAKPGMPADGEILVEGDQFPEGTRKK
jgi:HlyD family secretion protein